MRGRLIIGTATGRRRTAARSIANISDRVARLAGRDPRQPPGEGSPSVRGRSNASGTTCDQRMMHVPNTFSEPPGSSTTPSNDTNSGAPWCGSRHRVSRWQTFYGSDGPRSSIGSNSRPRMSRRRRTAQVEAAVRAVSAVALSHETKASPGCSPPEWPRVAGLSGVQRAERIAESSPGAGWKQLTSRSSKLGTRADHPCGADRGSRPPNRWPTRPRARPRP